MDSSGEGITIWNTTKSISSVTTDVTADATGAVSNAIAHATSNATADKVSNEKVNAIANAVSNAKTSVTTNATASGSTTKNGMECRQLSTAKPQQGKSEEKLKIKALKNLFQERLISI